METKAKIRNALMAVMLFLIALTFTSCDALLGGEITFGYVMGNIVCLIVGFFAWVILGDTSLYSALINEGIIEYVPGILALILEILPFFWHPIPKFNLILLIVNIAQLILIPVIWKKIDNGEIKLPKSKKEREREAKEAAERQAREEQEAKERAEREAREEAERKALEEQEAKEAAQKAVEQENFSAELSQLESELAAKQQELASLGSDVMAIMKKAKLNNEIKALEAKIAEIKG